MREKSTTGVSAKYAEVATFHQDNALMGVLENGGVAEQGTHKELMALKGKYYLLFTTQAKKYEDGQILRQRSF